MALALLNLNPCSSDLRRNIENLEKNSVTSLRTLVNLGSEVYMQADVYVFMHLLLSLTIHAATAAVNFYGTDSLNCSYKKRIFLSLLLR